MNMPTHQNITIDCIPDVHFSPHVIPPLLEKIAQTEYALLLCESGLGLSSGRSNDINNLDPTHPCVLQHKYAEQSGTLDVGMRLAEVLQLKPTNIDHPTHWAFAMEQYSHLKPEEINWEDCAYRSKIRRIFRSLFIRRDSWMVDQIKQLALACSGKDQRPVRLLLLVGLGHAPVLKNSLDHWCQWNTLIDHETLKRSMMELLIHHNPDASDTIKASFEDIDSIEKLRRDMLLSEMLGWGVPQESIEDYYNEFAPEDLTAERTEEYYYDSATIQARFRYKDNALSGLGEYFFEDGQQQSTTEYSEGKAHGECRSYYPDGKLRFEGRYRLGLFDSLCKWFHPNGHLACEAEYKNGVQDGITSHYHEDGYIESRRPYRDGKQHGESTTFHANGNPKSVYLHENGMLSGLSRSFYENGAIKQETPYETGKITGKIKKYHPNGKLKSIQPYQNDQAQGIIQWFHETGQLKSEIPYTNDEREGLAKFYHESGELKSEIPYVSGKAKGLTKYFYENRKLKSEILFLEDNREGLAKFYFESGKLQGERNYKQGKAHGISRRYDESGTLLREGSYDMGKLISGESYSISQSDEM